jgi:dsDNA-specific endonuclease/ATPase MutS2
MRFAAGAEVFVATLQKKGAILEVAANGRYRVAVGPLTVWCTEADLSSMAQAKKQARRDRNSGSPAATGDAAARHEPTERERRALASLDLHGLTVEEALLAVGTRLDLAMRAGLERVEIIHGISGGRLRAAVRGYLAGIGSVRRFEPAPGNPGVTVVYL